MRRAALAFAAVTLAPAAALAAGKADAASSRPLVLVFAMAALSLIPFALLMLTCFVRVSVVLSILRSAIGAAQVPPTQVLTGLAMILTLYVMAPTGERIYRAVQPVLNVGAGADLLSVETVGALQIAGDRAKEPLREFLAGRRCIPRADDRDMSRVSAASSPATASSGGASSIRSSRGG